MSPERAKDRKARDARLDEIHKRKIEMLILSEKEKLLEERRNILRQRARDNGELADSAKGLKIPGVRGKVVWEEEGTLGPFWFAQGESRNRLSTAYYCKDCRGWVLGTPRQEKIDSVYLRIIEKPEARGYWCSVCSNLIGIIVIPDKSQTNG